MTDWIEHNGGPQPVGDDVWVEVWILYEGPGRRASMAAGFDWPCVRRYRILNQHLIDAARLEGIRLGLEAAAKAADDGADYWRSAHKDGRYLEGRTDGLGEAAVIIRALDPETIAREAVLDQLTSEAQAQNMGYDHDDAKETAR